MQNNAYRINKLPLLFLLFLGNLFFLNVAFALETRSVRRHYVDNLDASDEEFHNTCLGQIVWSESDQSIADFNATRAGVKTDSLTNIANFNQGIFTAELASLVPKDSRAGRQVLSGLCQAWVHIIQLLSNEEFLNFIRAIKSQDVGRWSPKQWALVHFMFETYNRFTQLKSEYAFNLDEEQAIPLKLRNGQTIIANSSNELTETLLNVISQQKSYVFSGDLESFWRFIAIAPKGFYGVVLCFRDGSAHAIGLELSRDGLVILFDPNKGIIRGAMQEMQKLFSAVYHNLVEVESSSLDLVTTSRHPIKLGEKSGMLMLTAMQDEDKRLVKAIVEKNPHYIRSGAHNVGCNGEKKYLAQCPSVFIAIFYNNFPMLKFLVEEMDAEVGYVNPKALASDGVLAISGKQLDILSYLLKKGLDPNQVDARGKSLLMHAVMHQVLDAVLLLLTQGANANYQTSGVTALGLAVINVQNSELADVLLANGANPGVAYFQGRSLVEVVRESDDDAMKAVFAKYGYGVAGISLR